MHERINGKFLLARLLLEVVTRSMWLPVCTKEATQRCAPELRAGLILIDLRLELSAIHQHGAASRAWVHWSK